MWFEHSRASARVLMAAVAVVLAGYATSLPAAALAAVPPLPIEFEIPLRDAATEHVVVISIDGLRPDAIARFRAVTLQRLMSEGSYSLHAQTIMPSRTLPSHTSMLTGEEPEGHGITWNRNQTHEHGHSEVPTVFAHARERGLHTAAFFSKGKFHHLNVPQTLDYAQVPSGDGMWSARRTVANVEQYLENHRPNLMFVHFGEPDYAGHVFSWMSWPYGRAVRRADRAVARVIEAADRAFGEGNYTLIVTADHGGHGWNHGSSDPRDVTIPWIAWGKQVRMGTVLADGIRTLDTAATALWLLGISEVTTGRPVQTAFVPRTLPSVVAEEESAPVEARDSSDAGLPDRL